jgi:predicted small secreted protein
MIKKLILLLVLVLVTFSYLGCHTAKGLREDITYIGDKTAEIINKNEK